MTRERNEDVLPMDRMDVVRTILVRHACAGGKEEWDGPDRNRPLDEVGVAQARALADHLGSVRPARLLASPTRRCVQTLEELARRLGQDVTTCPVLGAEASPQALFELLASPANDGAILCTHGEVLEALAPVLAARADHGVTAHFADLQKGSLWPISIESGTGRVTSVAHQVPAGAPAACQSHPTWCD